MIFDRDHIRTHRNHMQYSPERFISVLFERDVDPLDKNSHYVINTLSLPLWVPISGFYLDVLLNISFLICNWK